MRILIVEDEVRLAGTLADIISSGNDIADISYDGISGLDNALSGIAVLKITNEGENIPQEDLSKIFQRFYRVDKARISGGYGLGLAIAKSIVDEHGGKITVKSEESLTTFSVQLRLA